MLAVVAGTVLFVINWLAEYFIDRQLDVSGLLIGLAYSASFILLQNFWGAIVRRKYRRIAPMAPH